MNKKKENRMAVRQAAAKAVLRDEQNRRIQFAATNPEGEVLKNLRTTLRGLDGDAVTASRAKYGSNKVTHEKKKSLAQRLAGAFVNPFTAILFCLALVSTMTDMVFPYFSLLGSVPEDFDPLTVVIILTMVLISGTLRFVQESRSGNAAEKLLAMITTTCMVTRQEQEKVEIPMDDLVVGDIVHLSAGDMIPADVRILEVSLEHIRLQRIVEGLEVLQIAVGHAGRTERLHALEVVKLLVDGRLRLAPMLRPAAVGCKTHGREPEARDFRRGVEI